MLPMHNKNNQAQSE